MPSETVSVRAPRPPSPPFDTSSSTPMRMPWPIGRDFGARGPTAALLRSRILARASALLLARRQLLVGGGRAHAEAPSAAARHGSRSDLVLTDHADCRIPEPQAHALPPGDCTLRIPKDSAPAGVVPSAARGGSSGLAPASTIRASNDFDGRRRTSSTLSGAHGARNRRDHGGLHTFKVCCRVVRGFALSNETALTVLRDWNLRCQPPWSEHELRDKINRARRYGREPIGSLCGGHVGVGRSAGQVSA